jgi:hypothetical protein
MNNVENLPIPPIIKQYIVNMMDNNIQTHARENYRDILDKIRIVCEEAVMTFDKGKRYNKHNYMKKR